MILILENLEGLWRKFLSQGQKVSFLPYHAHSFPRNLNDPPKTGHMNVDVRRQPITHMALLADWCPHPQDAILIHCWAGFY